ncbi:MAG: glycosyltransferase, partial [Planctomycetaceae bacterium]|nr:glycosyltransferase [Planctomycetaceae bacterium]
AGHDDGHEAVLRSAAKELQLEDAVLFTGFLAGILKSGAFAAAEVFALPSRDENFGVSVIEAMAHGAAPLVTHGVGAHVHVDESGCGLTVEDDVVAIRQGLAQLLRSDPRSLGRRGIAYVEANLSWSGIARQLDELYRGAIETQAHRPMVAA